MKKEEIIKILKTIREEIRKNYKAEIKGIFGSYAMGRQKENSDLDILVTFFEGASLFNLVALGDFLEKKLNLKVDIVPLDTIREEIKDEILKNTIYL